MILKHRVTEVLRFDWLEPEGVRVTSVNDAALRFLPLEMHGEPTDEQLWRWLRHRIVPSHRAHVQDMLLKLGYDAHDTRGIIRLCRGLSVNDVHWVVEDDFEGCWKDFNLYDNEFSDTVAPLDYSQEGLPFADGVQGVLVWGGSNTLKVTVGRGHRRTPRAALLLGADSGLALVLQQGETRAAKRFSSTPATSVT